MFVNIPGNVSSPVIAHRDGAKNQDYGEPRGDSVKQKLYEDSLIDLKEMQNFFSIMLTSKFKNGSPEMHQKPSVDVFV